MKTFAISLYDNEAESEDELTFKKNDLIQVLNINYMGMDGWWLCKLIKTNQVGLAAGNRLKVINDENLLNKIQKLLVVNNNKNNNNSNINNQISLSSTATSPTTSTSSSCSVTSSSSNSLDSTNSTPCIFTTTNSRLQTLSLQPTTSSHKPLALPVKTKLAESSENILSFKATATLLSKFNSKTIKKDNDNDDQDEEDDYDYDIPENNKSVKPELKLNTSQTRKSTSPTIDSGISTSSLMSLSLSSNDETNLTRISKSDKLKIEYESKLDKLNQFLTQKHDSTFNKNQLIQFRQDLNDFIVNYLKVIKQDHASFHPNLGIFNRFKTIYRQIKEFYLFYESIINKFDKLYTWNFDLISKQNELNELDEKLKYLNLDLIASINKMINDNKLFEYHETQTINKNNENNSNNNNNNNIGTAQEEGDSYQYVYDVINPENKDDDLHQEEESDYCTIDDNYDSKEDGRKPVPEVSTPIKTNQYCQTLKKNDEKIRREIRLATDNNPNETSRINMCDQMLLKFYLKHIEDNLNELSQIHENLVSHLDDNNYNLEEFNDQAHKLALNGHKLLFICDTLQRNLNNLTIKNCLTESSQELCDSLKFYMIRIKSLKTSNNKLILDSLNSVLNTSNKFKQIILKYYFKSY